MRTWMLMTAVLVLAFAVMACTDPLANVNRANVSDKKEEVKIENAGDKVKFSNDGSKVEFTGSKVTGKHDGGFKTFSGEIFLDKGNFAGVWVEIDVASVWTDDMSASNKQLDKHLMSKDFFDAEGNPKAHFVTTNVTRDGDKYKIEGNFTLRGITKNIGFDADIKVEDKAVKAKAEFKINRMEYDVKYPGKADDLIRNDVAIRFDINAKRG